MVNVLSSSFDPCFGSFPMLLVEGSSKTGYILDIYLTTFLGIHKIKKTSSFFWKFSKLNLISKMQKKKVENIFCFWESWIWKCSYKLSLLSRKYLLLAVNGLKNSPEILHITQRGFFSLNFLQRDESMWWRCCRSALNCVSAGLPFYLPKGLLKRNTFDIYLTTCFGIRKFKNTSAMGDIVFLKIF